MLPGSPRRAALCGALVSVLAGVLCTPAGAATPVKFQMSPAGGGAYPRFAVRPGEHVAGSVRLRSRSTRAQTIRLQSLDLVTARTGGIEFAGGRPRATGGWLTLKRKDVRLAPRSTRVVRFTVSVPTAAPAGEHFAGIVAIDRGEMRRAGRPVTSKGVDVRHVSRIALPVRLRIRGAAARRLSVRDATFAADASGSSLHLGLRSTGNLLVRSTKVDLRIQRPDGKTAFRHRAELSEFVPRTTINYPVPWRGVPTPGSYHVTGTITPQDGPVVRVNETANFRGPEAKRLEDQTGTPPSDAAGIPLLVVIALIAAMLVAIGASASYLRLRRRIPCAEAPSA